MSAASDLTGRAVEALRWNYLGTVGRLAATFVSPIALARGLQLRPDGSGFS